MNRRSFIRSALLGLIAAPTLLTTAVNSTVPTHTKASPSKPIKLLSVRTADEMIKAMNEGYVTTTYTSSDGFISGTYYRVSDA